MSSDARLADLIETIYSNLDLREVLQVVTDTGTTLSKAQVGAFFYNATDDNGDAYRLHVLSGESAAKFAHLPAPRITALFEPTFTGRSVIRIGDVTTHPGMTGMPKGHIPVRSYLSAPVISRNGEVIGALLFGHEDADVFDEPSEAVVVRIAAHAAAAVENARLFEAEQAARRSAEEAVARLRLLHQITSRLATALTAADAVDVVVDTLLEEVGASRMGVYSFQGDHFEVLPGRKRDSTDPSTPKLQQVPSTLPTPVCDAYRSGEPVVLRDLEEVVGRYPELAPHLDGVDAVLALPLMASGRTVGVLGLSWSSPQQLQPGEVDLLAAAAGQLAAALERSRLYEAEAAAQAQLRAHVAEVTDASLTLQRSLLPRTLPCHDRFAVAVRYLPGTAGAAVGGDWYDVIAGPTDEVTFVVGDVQGHSVTAAAVMGQLRMALYAYIAEGHAPDVAVARVNRLMLSLDTNLLATCVLVTLNAETGEACIVRAGHPLPVVRHASGQVVEVGAEGGIPLGIDEDATWPTTSVALEAGDRMLLYTDGLVERRDADVEAGVARLMAAAQVVDDPDVENAADRILTVAGGGLTDDVALLVCDYVGPAPATETASLTIDDTAAVSDARDFARDVLGRWGLLRLDDTVMLLVSEMVTNALVHAGGTARLGLRRAGDGLRIMVSDPTAHEPRPKPATTDALGGRGMLLVEMLSAAWGVEPSGGGKTVWAEVLE